MKKLDSPLLVAILVAAAYGIFIGALLEARDGDISRFVVAGGPGVDPSRVPKGLTVTDSGGFDGVAFYRLALNPFTRQETAYGIKLDNPPYRHQRIGYPLLVWIASLGHSAWVPAALVAVNFIAVIAIGAMAATLSRRWGHHALWGLIVPFYPGFVLSLSRDLCEIVASAFALGAILALTARRPVVSALLLTFAVLTRETSLILAVAILVVYAWRRGPARFVFLVPVAAYVVWQVILGVVWGTMPVRSVDTPDLAMPFVAWAQFLGEALPRRIKVQRLYFAESVYWALVVVTAGITWWRSRATTELRLAWLGDLATAATLGSYFWYDDFGFMRIFADLFVVSAVLILGAGRIARSVTLLATLTLWDYLARFLVAAK